ncbi:MAG: hypothetical protein GF388_03595 [Candidatus Aegiribacteria sp.]|nr:hypothetical protein [Candidatus Aegiribacteria sp.]MBD3294347.1 hypothetical protein [Candidatus Fermentibacteria bacterium]
MGKTVSELGERGLIANLRENISGLRTVGDDSAVLSSSLRCPVVTTDSFFEGTHFHRWWAPPSVLGRRFLEATLSDIAAMGAQPRWLMVALSLESSMELEWLTDFFRGLDQRQDVTIAGGETVGGNTFGLTLTAIGEGSEPDSLMTRSTLTAGDSLWVSGRLGRALDAPSILDDTGGMTGDRLMPVKGSISRDRLVQLRAFLKPKAELELGMELRKAGIRTAIDISDGLFSEAQHLARESGVNVRLDITESLFFDSVRMRPLKASAAGEDFVLLFAAPSKADFTSKGCMKVGIAEAGDVGVRVFIRGKEADVEEIGYDHLEVQN